MGETTPVGQCHNCGGPTLPDDDSCPRCGSNLLDLSDDATAAGPKFGSQPEAVAGGAGPAPSVPWSTTPGRSAPWAIPPGASAPGRTLAIVSAALLGFISVAYVVMAVMLSPVLDPDASPALPAGDYFALVDALDQASLVASLVLAAAFLAWLYRSTQAVPLLEAGQPATGPAGSVLWWFVPFVNLVKPYLIVRDLWDRLGGFDGAHRGWVVSIWWVTFVGGNVATTVSDFLFGDATTESELQAALAMAIVGIVTSAIAAAVAIWVIVEIERRKDARLASMRSGALPA